MLNLYKKEINYYLNNPVGYVVIVLFAVFSNFLFIKDIFIVGSASMKPFFSVLPWLLMIFIPALAMRVFSEEKRNNTIEVLLTLPVSETQIVLAKFLAILTLVLIGLFLTTGLSVSLSFMTKIYMPEIIVGYLGILLLSSFYISLTMFFSSLTKNQVITFLSSVVTIFLLLVVSTGFSVSVLPRFILDRLIYFSPFEHLQNFIKGVIDLRSFFYFASFSIMFLFLTIINIEKKE